MMNFVQGIEVNSLQGGSVACEESCALLCFACAGKQFKFDEAFGHKSCLKAVKETAGVWMTGLFLLVVAQFAFLTTWLKKNSLKPGEGKADAALICNKKIFA